MTIFTDVKENVTIEQAAQYLGLKLIKTAPSGERRYKCPVCETKDPDPLCIGDQAFTCYGTGKKPHGDVIALVAHCKGISQTEAAKLLAKHFLASASTATKPRQTTADGEGGRSVAGNAPALELLGISDDLAELLGILVEDGRVLFEMRDPQGVKHGTLGIATRDDIPLVEWTEQHQPAQKDGLKGLWRVVKGKA